MSEATKVEKPPRLPLAVRPSIWKAWAGTGLFCVFGAAIAFFAHRDLLVVALPFLALVCLATLVRTLDRRPRLILERDGVRWRESPGRPLVFTPWEQVSCATHEQNLRTGPNHDAGWLHLAFAPPPGGSPDAAPPAPAKIWIHGQTVWGEDLPDLIRSLAPHVRVTEPTD